MTEEWPSYLAKSLLSGRITATLERQLDALLIWLGNPDNPHVAELDSAVRATGLTADEAAARAYDILDGLLFANPDAPAHAVLGLGPATDPITAKQRYRCLIQAYHPDRHPARSEAHNDRTERINLAYGAFQAAATAAEPPAGGSRTAAVPAHRGSSARRSRRKPKRPKTPPVASAAFGAASGTRLRRRLGGAETFRARFFAGLILLCALLLGSLVYQERPARQTPLDASNSVPPTALRSADAAAPSPLESPVDRSSLRFPARVAAIEPPDASEGAPPASFEAAVVPRDPAWSIDRVAAAPADIDPAAGAASDAGVDVAKVPDSPPVAPTLPRNLVADGPESAAAPRATPREARSGGVSASAQPDAGSRNGGLTDPAPSPRSRGTGASASAQPERAVRRGSGSSAHGGDTSVGNAAVPTSPGSSDAEPVSDPAAPAECAPAKTVLERFRDAYNAGALGGLMALYGPDARENHTRGWSEIRKLYERWFRDTRERRIAFSGIELQGAGEQTCRARSRFRVSYRDLEGRRVERSGTIDLLLDRGRSGLRILTLSY